MHVWVGCNASLNRGVHQMATNVIWLMTTDLSVKAGKYLHVPSIMAEVSAVEHFASAFSDWVALESKYDVGRHMT